MENEDDKQHYILSNKDTTFLVIRDPKCNNADINIKDKKDNFTLVFDIENLCKKLNPHDVQKFIDKKNIPQNIIIKNCVLEKPSNIFEDLNLNLLYISDELYSMSANLNILFQNVKSKKLVLKKMKINSKLQLQNFLDFIINIKCEELTLEDIFIELIIKENENDETYNEMGQFISFEKGKFYIIKNDEKIKTNIKKLKMIDCPLFALIEKSFEDIKQYKDISIDIDENSFLNPNIVSKFKIDEGYSDICFDLDSYKYNEDKPKDYVDCLDYIFNIIIDNNNHNFKKINFKNFDITKYEYITGEFLTFIDESNWILNDGEKKRKEKFEKFNTNINSKINDNLNKLSNIRELILDNCTNYFIDLILKFINHSKNGLDNLKIKKCGKEYFDLNNIIFLNVKHLILFDTPLTNFPEDKELEELGKKGKLGQFDKLTIKISSLDHYCLENNLDYYNTIATIEKLIKNDNFNKNYLCFEMNALPIIMTFLVAREYNKDKKLKPEIPDYFYFCSSEISDECNKEEEILKYIDEGIKNRDNYKKKSFALINNKKGINDKKIILKKNNIKNTLDNYEYYYRAVPKFQKGRSSKEEFGKDIFNLDIDYKSFFEYNSINNIILDNCLFSCTSSKVPSDKFSEINETIINLINTNQQYTLDMKSFIEIIFKNKSANDLTYIFKYLYLKNGQTIYGDTREYLENLKNFIKDLEKIFNIFIKLKDKITIVFQNIKERKEFYCILCFANIIMDKNNFEDLQILYHSEEKYYNFPKKELILSEISKYYVKKENEENQKVCSYVFNYYYTSKEEEVIFKVLDKNNNTIKIGLFTFKIENKFDYDYEWDIIMK